jgi:hypothetical protein
MRQKLQTFSLSIPLANNQATHGILHLQSGMQSFVTVISTDSFACRIANAGYHA